VLLPWFFGLRETPVTATLLWLKNSAAASCIVAIDCSFLVKAA
jgi:hypothetical protein